MRGIVPVAKAGLAINGGFFTFRRELWDVLRPGEELAYDYAYERSGDETEKEERQYRCLCGTRACRGSIMEPRETYEARQRAQARKKAAARRQRERAKAQYGSQSRGKRPAR